MEEAQIDFRRWDELIPEALVLIFSFLSLEELLTVVPCVCNSWRNAVLDPHCWQRIDLTQWSNWCNRHRSGTLHLAVGSRRTPKVIGSSCVDRMLRMLITRSRGSLRELCVPNLVNDAIFSFITDNAGSLQVLRMPGSGISVSIVEQTAQRLSNITVLDLSCCWSIGPRALEAIGKHCKLLVTLCRNLIYGEGGLCIFRRADDEVDAIAATMTGLKHLEISRHVISTRSALNLLFSCPQLEFLDITGYWGGKLEVGFLKEKFPKLEARGLYLPRWG